MKKSIKKCNKKMNICSSRTKKHNNKDILDKFKAKKNNNYYSLIKDDLNKIQRDYEKYEKLEANRRYYNTVEFEESKQNKNYEESNYDNLRKFIEQQSKIRESDGNIDTFGKGYSVITKIPYKEKSKIPYNTNKRKNRITIGHSSDNINKGKNRITIGRSTDNINANMNKYSMYNDSLERRFERLKKENEIEKNLLNNKITKLQDLITDLKKTDIIDYKRKFEDKIKELEVDNYKLKNSLEEEMNKNRLLYDGKIERKNEREKKVKNNYNVMCEIVQNENELNSAKNQNSNYLQNLEILNNELKDCKKLLNEYKLKLEEINKANKENNCNNNKNNNNIIINSQFYI